MKKKLIFALISLMCILGIHTQNFGLLKGVGETVERTTDVATEAARRVTGAATKTVRHVTGIVTSPLTGGDTQEVDEDELTMEGMDEDKNPANNLPKDILELNKP